ncbi:endonuclease G [Klenkia soli]|uniref:Endonuclease G n=1 Tax=Klenkia soli TaxID=1052260 RepID=A0A1H0ISK9_9ACTN|nr:hypothetical protein [Klenkia soli]SDO34456.1 endonuclease G [Klenkia soli]
MQIPLRFYKVAVFVLAHNGTPSGAPVLGATGYVLDQTPQVADLPDILARAHEVGAPPPLGPFRTSQVPIADIAALTGLDWSAIAPLDRLLPAGMSSQAASAP